MILKEYYLCTIENLECSDNFRAVNFNGSSYTDKQNKSQPEYLITKDGFAFLIMGFTGKEAAEFKEKYITAFNYMAEALRHRNLLEQIYSAQVSINRIPPQDKSQALLKCNKLNGKLKKERINLTIDPEFKQIYEIAMPFLDSTFSEALEIGIINQLELLDPITALDLKIKQTEEKLVQLHNDRAKNVNLLNSIFAKRNDE